MKPKGIFLSLVLLLVTATMSFGQTQFWSDTFEHATNPSSGTRTSSLNQGGGGPPYTYYFLRTNGSNIDLQAPVLPETATEYLNVEGEYFWAGEDTDRVGTGANNPADKVQHVIWSGIDISGKTGLSFRGLFAANNGHDWQNITGFPEVYDFLEVEYRIDGGTWVRAGGFYADQSSGIAGRMREDTNGDRIGDGMLLSRTMQEVTWSIIGTGSTLDLRFRASADASGTQEFAIDNFRLFEVLCTPPTIDSHPIDQEVCAGDNATFSITVTGASAYQWQVNTGSGFVDISNGGVYSGVTTTTLTITEVTSAMDGYLYRCVAIEASCETPSNAAELIADLTATTSQTNVSCFGGNNGTATVTASGGAGGYTYSWNTSPVQTTATATGLSVGNYTVTITDANDCVITREFTITQPSPLAATVGGQTNVSCFGGTNGTATVSVTGGTGPGTYSYSWAPSGGTAATATGLSAGTYTVTVTDGNFCQTTQQFTITQPSALVASSGGQTNVSCFGGNDGSATVSVTGGTGSYSYSWAPSGGTDATATGLSAGDYTVTVTDANSCTTTQSFTITEPPVLVASAGFITNVSCFNGNDGEATVSVAGGTAPYSYSWDDLPEETAATASGLAVGTYTVTVTDDKGCEDTQTFTITQPSAIAITVNAITHVTTYGGNDGSATVSASGGTGPSYTYSWAPSGGTAATATGLSAGTYTVTVTDANNCSTTQDVEITEPQPPVITNLDGDEVSFTEGGPAVLLDEGGDATVSDSDSPDFDGGNLTVSIVANGIAAEDIVAIRNEGTGVGEIGVSEDEVRYGGTLIGTITGEGTNAADLVISFTSNATPAAAQALISNLTYSNSNTLNPSINPRTIRVTLNDGGGATSEPSDVTVTIVAINDAPHLTRSGPLTTFTEVLGDTPLPIAVDDGITVSDPDNETLAWATVSITANYYGNQDVLAFTNNNSSMGDVSGSFDEGTGVLALTSTSGTATLAQWQAALRSVNYSNTSKAPETVNRAITFVVHDGVDSSNMVMRQIEIIDVNDPPTIDAPTSIEVVENVATALTGISVDDPDAGANAVTATFSIPIDRGTLTAPISGDIAVTVVGSHTVVLEGPLADINNYIADGELQFTNALDDLDDVPLDMTINDNENTGSGPAQLANEQLTITVRSTVPRINRVYSPDADVLYGSGSLITIHVEFDREVIATEVGDGIRLLLATGVPGRFASYVSGSGEETLVFQYTVQPGDESTHLDYLNTGALELAIGSTIESSEAGVGADLTLPTPGTTASLSGSSQLIVDGIAPTALAKDITLELDADGVATLAAGDVNDGSSDNLTPEGDLVFTINQTDFDCSDIGPVEVTLTVTDEAGNEASATATVTVVDVTAPIVQTRNIIVALDVDGEATITSEMVDDGSDDACGIATLVLSKMAFNSEDLGINMVTFTATDHSGNESNATATVVVVAFEDDSFVYDGTAKSLSIAGELPSGVAVTYTGNGQTEAGIYTVTATVDGGDDFNDLVLTAELAITKASLADILTLDDDSFVYDGTAKSLAILGDLPDGAEVTYTDNGQTEVGSYTITATIDGGNNYLDLVLTAELEITKAQLVDIITFDDDSFVYDGTAKSLTISGDLPEGTEVTYTGNGRTEAGVYTVTATIDGGNNYENLMLTAELEITKASLTDVITLVDGSFVYDGAVKSLAISGDLPEGTEVTYAGNGQTDADSYTVTATIDGGNNYLDLVLTAELEITKAQLVDIITFDDQSFVYDGTAKSLTISGDLPDGTEVTYTGNGQTEVGVYTVTGTIDGGNNYEDLVLTATLEITAPPEISVTFPSSSFVYDGTHRSLSIVGELPEGVTVTYTNNGRVNVGVQTVTATIDGGNNHQDRVLTATLEITPATRTMDFPTLLEKTYGDADFSAGATASSGEPVTYISSDESVAEIVDGSVRITGAGTATITATVPDNGNYSNRPTTSQVLTVRKATQSITFEEVGDVSRDAGSIPLIVSVSSGLPVSLAIDDEQVATLDGNTLTILRLGTIRITATQAGDANHEAAESITITVRVVDPSENFPVRVHQAVSPNGDGINDFLMIEGIRDYPENRLTILNRNGTIVWEAAGYDNDRVAFRGIGTGQLRVAAGTYFYVLEVKDTTGGWFHKTGYFVLRY